LRLLRLLSRLLLLLVCRPLLLPLPLPPLVAFRGKEQAVGPRVASMLRKAERGVHLETPSPPPTHTPCPLLPCTMQKRMRELVMDAFKVKNAELASAGGGGEGGGGGGGGGEEEGGGGGGSGAGAGAGAGVQWAFEDDPGTDL
jgi:hypothetical protein